MSINILPGFGGAFEEEITDTGAGTEGSVVDVSKCAAFAVQVTAKSGSSATIQAQMSLDAINWANLGTTFNATLGEISRFSAFAGPYGLIRFVLDSAGTTTVTLKCAGFPMAWSS